MCTGTILAAYVHDFLLHPSAVFKTLFSLQVLLSMIGMMQRDVELIRIAVISKVQIGTFVLILREITDPLYL